jgi:hypothetical protein
MLTQRMDQWRNGELSDSEILGYLLEAQAEVQIAMRKAETIIAEQRMRRLGLSHEVPYPNS